MNSSDPISVLNGRCKRQAGLSYRLSETSDRYGLDTVLSGQADFDQSRMSMKLLFASGSRRDGVGDLLEVEGIRTERHRLNPVVLFDHGKQPSAPILPIAMACVYDPQTGRYDKSQYTVTIDPIAKEAWCEAYFYQGNGFGEGEFPNATKGDQYDHAILCEQYYHMAVTGLLQGGSIGYQVIKAMELAPDYARGTPQGLHLLIVLMLECSLVVMPANMDTVLKALEIPTICGKPLSPYLVKSLEAFAPQQVKTVVSVPDIKAIRKLYKAQPSDDISPDKARQILKDGTVHGKPLTDKQQGMFGAAAGKDIKDIRKLYKAQVDDPTPTPFASGHVRGGRKLPGVDYTFQPGDTVITRGIITGTESLKPFAMAGERVRIVKVITPHSTFLAENKRGEQREMAFHQIRKHLTVKTKGQGEPCKQGETADRSGCVPASNDAGSGSTSAKKPVKKPSKTPAAASKPLPQDSGSSKPDAAAKPAVSHSANAGRTFEPDAVPKLVEAFEWSQNKDAQSGEMGGGGVAWLPELHYRIRKVTGMDLTPDEFKGVISQLVDKGALELHILNEVRMMNVDDRRYAPERNDQVYAFATIKDNNVLTSALGETKVEPYKSKYGYKSLDFKGIRQLYKTAKGVRRRLKKSSPGASVMHIAGKDIKAAQEMAEQKGLKFHRVGHVDGAEKVKLIGDDNSIDEVAKAYGTRVKSLTGSKAMDNDAVEEINTDNETPVQEPHGAQVLRRMHEDHKILMKDYHDMMGPLEHEGVKKHLEKTLQGIEGTLGETEKHFAKHYKDLPPLEDAMSDMGDEHAEDEELDAEGAEKDMDDDTTEADSAEEELPSPEEAYEGSQKTPDENEKHLKNGKTKTLKKKVKSACPKCGKEGCECGKNLKKDMTEKEAGKIEGELEDVAGDVAAETSDTEKSLEPHQRSMISEAAKHCKALSETQTFEDDQRFDSHHHAKNLDGIIGDGQEPNPAIAEGETKSEPGSPEWMEEEANEPEHKSMGWHKTLSDASQFLHGVSREKAFGDAHRGEAAYHAQELEGVAGKSMPPEEIENKQDDPTEPGDIQEKALKQLLLSRQNKMAEMESLLGQLTAI